MVNTKKRKKRIKRQTLKRTKQTAAVSISFREIEDYRKEEQIRAYLERLNQVARHGEKYQSLLDQKYDGYVVPIDTFVNYRAVLKHQCYKCNRVFWKRPLHLLKYESQAHICGGNSKQYLLNEKLQQSEKNIVNKEELQKEILSLYSEGLSYRKIASKIGKSHYYVSQIIKKNLMKN